jgi:hypothetical protein
MGCRPVAVVIMHVHKCVIRFWEIEVSRATWEACSSNRNSRRIKRIWLLDWSMCWHTLTHFDIDVSVWLSQLLKFRSAEEIDLCMWNLERRVGWWHALLQHITVLSSCWRDCCCVHTIGPVAALVILLLDATLLLSPPFLSNSWRCVMWFTQFIFFYVIRVST